MPAQQGVARTARQLGFATFDLRDLQHVGVIDGVAQPNARSFVQEAPGIACSGSGPGMCNSPVDTTKTLGLDVAATDLDNAVAAKIAYDTRGDGSLSLTINDHEALSLPNQTTLASQAGMAWIRRSADVPIPSLRFGLNSLRFALSGDVDLDRIELELFYGEI